MFADADGNYSSYILDALTIIVNLLNPDPKGRMSIADVLASAEWLDSERCKELPETITTLALARQMSRPVLKVIFALFLPFPQSYSSLSECPYPSVHKTAI